ncbi:MAG TPA: 1,4-beta-xylanase [Opitutaceae bacterium]|jgi:hypothetical protein
MKSGRPSQSKRASGAGTLSAWPLAALLAVLLVAPSRAADSARWSPEKAKTWAASHPAPVGANYLPAYAVNQLEMWQADTFDLQRIDRELGWARDLGFNSMRVFLHNLAWREDPEGFLDRMDRFLGVAQKNGITVLFVVFDGVWNPLPHAGRQPAPTPGVHNSQWVQSPGVALLVNGSRHGELEAYVKSVLGRFRDDPRVCGWDLFNEPNNDNARSYAAKETPEKEWYSLILLHEVFRWATEADPSQPLTSGVWRGTWDVHDPAIDPVARFQLENSDVISFHCYRPLNMLEAWTAPLGSMGRPLWCTEYMARPMGSTFEAILPYLRRHGVGAYCWGFVSGKSQTKFAWSTWGEPEKGEPHPWFHDILRTDGTPYDPTETRFLRELLTGSSSGAGR